MFRIEIDVATGKAKQIELTPEEIAAMMPDPAPSVEDYQNAIQALVDEAAVSRHYKSGDAMATYVASTVSAWASEAQAFVAWRDNVWQYAYSELAKVQGGERAQPTVTEFLAEIDPIVWP